MKKLVSFLLVLLVAIVGVFATTVYVSSNGSDSNNGSLSTPFATITKAYSSLPSTGGTIALLSDVNMTSGGLTVSGSKNITITSAKSDGSLVDNEEGNYDGVYTIHRGTITDSLIKLTDAELTLEQVILSGDKTVVGTVVHKGYLIDGMDATSVTVLTLGQNCVLKDNKTTSGGSCYGSGIVFGVESHSSYKPKMYMKKNAAIYGCIAPRHGGALTIYTGDCYMQDNSTMQYNGINYTDSFGSYFGGGAVLVYHYSALHMSGNASITKNFIQTNGSTDSSVTSRSHNAMQVDYVGSDNTDTTMVYISGNAKIFDNYDDGQLTYTTDGYKVTGSIEANAYSSKASKFIIDGALGDEAKIGITVKNAAINSILANGTSSYTITESDANKFFDDSNTYKIVKSSNTLVFASPEAVTISLGKVNATSKTISGTLGTDINVASSDFSVYLNGEKLESGYTVTVDGTDDKKFTVTLTNGFSANDTIGIRVLKNGYIVNSGNLATEQYKHSHTSVYSTSGTTISTYCTNEVYKELCQCWGSDNAVSISLIPAHLADLVVKVNGVSEDEIEWTSANEAVATVDSTGRVKSKGKGTTSIKATLQDGSGLVERTVTVN